MKLNYFSIAVFALAVSLFACTAADEENKEQKAVDKESMEAINEMMAHQAGTENYSENDKLVIDAYAKDKTTISVNDLDLKDTSYSTVAKILYLDATGAKLAVVFGLRNGKMGTAILQKEGGQAVRLPQTKDLGVGNSVYSDGGTTITTNGSVLTLEAKGKKEVYKRIES